VTQASYFRWRYFLAAGIWRPSSREAQARRRWANERAEHESEHGLFAEAVRDEFEPPALLGEQPVRGDSWPKSLYLDAKTACG
jgi:hypothetical protein